MIHRNGFGKIAVLLGSLLMSFTAPNDPSYLIVTVEAEDKHDFKDRLAEITAPTLVTGGDQDPFYSETLFRETAEGIPNARFIRLLKWFFQSSIFVIIPPEIGG